MLTVQEVINWSQIIANILLFLTLGVLSVNVIIYLIHVQMESKFHRNSLKAQLYPKPTGIIEIDKKNLVCLLKSELLNSGKMPALNGIVFSEVVQNSKYPTDRIKTFLKYPPNERVFVFPNQSGVHTRIKFIPDIDPKLFTYTKEEIRKKILDKKPELYLHFYFQYSDIYAFRASFFLTHMREKGDNIEYFAEMRYSSEERIN